MSKHTVDLTAATASAKEEAQYQERRWYEAEDKLRDAKAAAIRGEAHADLDDLEARVQRYYENYQEAFEDFRTARDAEKAARARLAR